MVWFCRKHEKHSIDDSCPDCVREPIEAEKRIFMAGYQAGAVAIVSETARVLKVRVAPWDNRDDERAANAYFQWRREQEHK